MGIGDFLDGDISRGDAISAARMGTGLLKKFSGPADVLLAGVQGNHEEQQGLQELAARFGNLQNAAQKSGIIKRKMLQLKDRWKDRMGEAAVSAAGAAAGAFVGTSIFPGLGTIAGLVVGGLSGMGGGFIADKIYCQFKPLPEQDAVAIAVTIDGLRREGYKIPKELVATLILAMQGGPTGKRLEQRLYEGFGTMDFNEGLQMAMTENKMPALCAIIKEFERSVSGSFQLPLDPRNPNRSLGAQVADMINSGTITATGIIANPRNVSRAYRNYLYQREREPEQQAMASQVPQTPSISRGRPAGLQPRTA